MDDNEFSKCLVEFQQVGEQSEIALSLLSDHASVNGLSLSQLTSSTDLLLQPSLPQSHRTQLLKGVLIPRDDHVLDPDLFWKLLAILGPSEVYYRNGKPCKLRRLEVNCQVAILQWLIEILPFFGRVCFSLIRRSYPILFKLLSHEFSRPQVVTLILYGASDPGFHRAKLFKKWHVETIACLSLKYPSDRRLLVLNWFVQRAGLTSTSWEEANGESMVEQLEASLVFSTGTYLSKFPNLVERHSTAARSEILDVWKDFELIREGLLSGISSRKMHKPNAKVEVKVINSTVHSAPSESSPWTLEDVANSLDANPVSIASSAIEALLSDSKFKAMSVCLFLLNPIDNQDLVKKIIRLIDLKREVIDQTEIYSRHSSLVRFADFGGMLELQSLINFDILSTEISSKNQWKLKETIELLPYLSIASVTEFLILVISYLVVSESQNLATSFFRSLALLLNKVRLSSSSDPKNGNDDLLNTLSSILPKIFGYALTKWSDLDLEVQLGFTRFLRSIISLDFQENDKWRGLDVLIPPRTLIYKLMFSTNPLIVSEILYYISYLKTLKFDKANEKNKRLINSLVYDGVNFFWKDLAFKNEGTSFSRAMYLEPEFLHRITGLNFFGGSEFLLVKSIGGLARNPAFAYIFAEIVWSLEDAQSDISIRHPGPLSEESVFRVQRDPDVSWVQMSYTDIKTSILYALVDSGFYGLGQFLCSSIKSLKKRQANE